MALEKIKEVAVPACQQFHVKQLDIFGSYARDEVGPLSDLDLLVEFEEPQRSPAKRFFGLLHHLEDNLHCKIDLLTLTGIKNPYFRQRVMRERVMIYGRPDSQTSA